MAKVRYSQNWFPTSRQNKWKQILGPLMDLKSVKYLEVGVHEGTSLIWVLKELFKGKRARATAVDPFIWNSRLRLIENLKYSRLLKKVKILEMPSVKALPSLKSLNFDLIYIDGDHTALGVFSDVFFSWELCRPGGFLVFDDYHRTGTYRPWTQCPDEVVDVWISARRQNIEKVVRIKGQVFVQKKSEISPLPPGVTPLGEYLYNWNGRRLLKKNGELVFLKVEDRMLIEKVGRTLKKGSVYIETNQPVFKTTKMINFNKRLGLKPKDWQLL